MDALGKRLRELRVQRRLTSSALAFPRYSVSFISQIERGHRNPSSDTIRFLAAKLGVSARYLATGVPDDVDAWLRYEIEASRKDLDDGLAAKAEERIRSVLQAAVEYDLGRVRAQALVILGEALAKLPAG
jgi:transcriptional regulator with XRE-family HTH domain